MKSCINKNCRKLNPQPVTEFYGHPSTKDGLRKSCKECHKEHKKLYGKEYYINNREIIVEKVKKYAIKNPAKINAIQAKRHASKVLRTPKWLTKEHYKEIEEFYFLAKDLLWLSIEELHVDHIVPLQGKNVSGLHVPWNLQLLTKTQNIKKGNK